jgi:hypothetical protein
MKADRFRWLGQAAALWAGCFLPERCPVHVLLLIPDSL